jgi:nicotinamide mononucleotide transporter
LIEPIAFVCAIAMVVCNIRQWHWGWPLAILSSLMYGWVFLSAKLYGEAALQVVFIALAGWGWRQWLLGDADSSTAKLIPRELPTLKAVGAALLGGLIWLGLAVLLGQWTDSDVPLADAFLTSGSVIATLLLARKYTVNWGLWLVVNVASVALFIYKDLWLSAALYALLAVMSVYGWLEWRRAAASLAVRSPQAS